MVISCTLRFLDFLPSDFKKHGLHGILAFPLGQAGELGRVNLEKLIS